MKKSLMLLTAAAASAAGYVAYRRSQAAPKVTGAIEGAADGVTAVAQPRARSVKPPN